MNTNYTKIAHVLEILGEPQIAEHFEGHPDDPSVLEEYYLEDSPSYPQTLLAALALALDTPFGLTSNVLTLYKR